MTKNFEDVATLGKDTFENGVKAFALISKGAQAIAVETSDYAKKAAEEHASTWKEILSAKSLENAIEIQSAYAKSSYEAFVAEATKLSGLYADLTKEAFRPFEVALAKAR